ncbi:MAG: hydrogenase maturation nickel metallochaperone HypA [Spirochaetota bacterium]|nr:hydrogenase maturation nickel metallochaperone HypA [Spirochaetota bacterium]
MHELSLAISILDIALKHAKEAQAEKVLEIELELGVLSCVMVDSLSFCFDTVCNGTIAEGANLAVREKPGMGACEECMANFEVKEYFTVCPKCGSPSVAISQGKELLVLSVTVD